MRRRPEPSALMAKRTLVSLGVMIILSVACQHSSGGNNKNALQENNQTANARAGGATTQNNQTGANNLANTNRQPADNAAENNATKPIIQITVVPSKGAGPDAMERIAGTVGGVNIKECKVVIFTRTDKWYVQPYIDSPDTLIKEDRTWENDTHLGSEYAALLVKTSYKPPATTGTLPNVAGPVLAIARETAK
jgi:hypothetical protein